MRGVVWNPPSGHSMARMHARRKGRSGSRRPLGAKNPDWVPLEPDEVEETIMRLAAPGKASAEIGLVPRGQYGVPTVRPAIRRLARYYQDRGVLPASWDYSVKIQELATK